MPAARPAPLRRAAHGWLAAAFLSLALTAALSLGGCGREEPAQPKPAPIQAAELAELDRGVGLMGQFDFAKAREVFAALAARHPDWYEARFDLAVATLNRQQEGDERAAAEQFAALLKERPDDVFSLYVSGIITLHSQSPRDAEPLLRRVADADPRDPYARYFLAQALLAQGRADAALALFDQAVALDPLLRSAHYGAAQALTRLGRSAEAAARLEDFQRSRNNPLARLAEFKYTRMGAKAEARGAPRNEQPTAAPSGALFDEAVTLRASAASRIRSTPISSGADIDGDGKVDLFLPGGRGARGQVLLRRANGFEAQADHPLAQFTDVEFVAWGDIDNDGLTDALLCRSGKAPLLVRQVSAGAWKPVDVPALDALGETRDCQLADIDNDGDLDILVVTRRGSRVLITNNGDGSFRVLTDRLPKPSRTDDAVQALVTDLDNRSLLNIVILHAHSPHEVLAQDGLWRWHPAKGFEAFAREPAVAAVAADLDGTGEPDLITLTPDTAIRRWRKAQDGIYAATTVVPASGPMANGISPQIAVADLDGDGRPEIIVSTADGVAVWKLSATGAERVLSLPSEAMTGWSIVNLDERGPALLMHRPDGAVTLRTGGPGRFQFALLSLSGGDDKSSATRSNTSGIGARVAARVDRRWVVQETLRNSSGPGQSLAPLAIGMGGAPKIDYVSIDWSDGVLQTELSLDAAKTHRIVETQRQLSSCPLVFAWNGERYGFVGDILGVGGIGYLLAPNAYAPPRPWENFLLPASALKPRNGRYALKIAEPMEEAAYIDSVRLVAHDLPPGWHMALDERMEINGPKVTGAPLYFDHEVLARHAVNDRGEDVTDALRDTDSRAADPGPTDRRFIGRLAREHVLTLDFPEDLDASNGRTWLVADGWIEYPYSQTMFAAWQAGADYRPPTLEAKGADGRWRVVLKEFGYPAGMPRTMAVPLPRLPRGTRSLRLRSNQEIYWDRIAIAWSQPSAAVARTLPLLAAEVRTLGFPHRTTGPQKQPGYDLSRLTPLWDTRIQSGFYTAFGRVDELVGKHDDGLAIIGPGEEIQLEFDATLPELKPGWSRRFVLETRGWAKDMDLYTRDGETLEPLPVTGQDAHVREQLNKKYNSRFASGR